MKITWLADYDTSDHKGGAQQTNKIMIDEGLLRGHDIEIMKPANFKRENVGDFVILNNLVFFNVEDINWIIEHKRYIRYEHDYYTLEHIDKYPLLFNNSLLNIFLSPLHAYEFRFIARKNVYLQASPVKGFSCLQKRRNNKVLYIGGLNQFKGFYEVIKLAIQHPELEFLFYGWVDDPHTLKELHQTKNCKYMGLIKNDNMNEVYNSASYFVHLPKWKEPFGRTILEAYLAGCSIIHNDNIGAFSYNWNWKDYQSIKEINDKLPTKFWEKIESVI